MQQIETKNSKVNGEKVLTLEEDNKKTTEKLIGDIEKTKEMLIKKYKGQELNQHNHIMKTIGGKTVKSYEEIGLVNYRGYCIFRPSDLDKKVDAEIMRMITSPYYKGSMWNLVLGSPVETSRGIDFSNRIMKDGQGNEIDYPHLVATLKGKNNYRLLPTFGLLVSWGGDLRTLGLDVKNLDKEEIKKTSKELITSDESYFSVQDFNADIDAENIYHLMKEDKYLNYEGAIKKYYKDDRLYQKRVTLFIKNNGGIDEVRKSAEKITRQNKGYANTWRELPITEMQRELFDKNFFGDQSFPSEDTMNRVVDGFIEVLEEKQKAEEK